MIETCLTILFALQVIFTIHESAHAFTAVQSGDTGPRECGRISLNPIAHMDWFGSLVLPVAFMLVTHGTLFAAYAKPVMVRPESFRKRRIGLALSAGAGPLASFASGLAATMLIPIASYVPFAGNFVVTFAALSLFVAFFSMLPVPPLDGSRVYQLLMPEWLAERYLASVLPLLAISIVGLVAARMAFDFDLVDWMVETIVFPLMRLVINAL